jgi:hypothetical protein
MFEKVTIAEVIFSIMYIKRQVGERPFEHFVVLWFSGDGYNEPLEVGELNLIWGTYLLLGPTVYKLLSQTWERFRGLSLLVADALPYSCPVYTFILYFTCALLIFGILK